MPPSIDEQQAYAATYGEDVIQTNPEIPTRSNQVFEYGEAATEQYQQKILYSQPKERWHWAFNRIVQVGQQTN